MLGTLRYLPEGTAAWGGDQMKLVQLKLKQTKSVSGDSNPCWEWDLLLWEIKHTDVGKKWKSFWASQQIAESFVIP